MDAKYSASEMISDGGNTEWNGRNSGQQSDRLEKTLAFWKFNFQVLLKPQVVIFAGIIENNVTNNAVIDIMKQLVNLNLINHVKALFPLTNKSFTFIEFTSSEYAIKFQTASKYINNVKTVFINPEAPAKFVNIFIDKLPVYILQEYLPKILLEWGEVVDISPSYMKLLNGKTCETGSSRVRLRLKNGISVTDIPYFIKIDKLKTYLHIPQRQKICFRCLSADHLVSQCTYKFCHSCRAYKEVPHSCHQSYAQKVSSSLNNWQASLIKAQEDCLADETSTANCKVIVREDTCDTNLQSDAGDTTVEESVHQPEAENVSGNPVDAPDLSMEEDTADNGNTLPEQLLTQESGNKHKDSAFEKDTLINLEKNSEQIGLAFQKKKRTAADSLLGKNKRKLMNEATKTYALRNKTDNHDQVSKTPNDCSDMEHDANLDSDKVNVASKQLSS